MKKLILITRPAVLAQEERLLKLAEWMGVPTARVVLEGESLAWQQIPAECAVAMSTETLAILRQRAASDFLAFLHGRCAQLLVFHCGSSPLSGDVLTWLTSSQARGLQPVGVAKTFHFPRGGRDLSRQFAGLDFSLERPEAAAALDVPDAAGSAVQVILAADSRPVFLRTERGPCEIFLLCAAELPDPGVKLSPRAGAEHYYDRLLPLLIFLRRAFGATCWHGLESTARLIIDDPLLDHTYGFLRYEALRDSMRSAGYGTTIAFIPWNYWRTSKRKGARIFDQQPNLSICVHGCDHSNREFDDLDPGRLEWRAGTALRRMEKHEQRTGLPFERVMVFPQGRFSSPAMQALRATGYVAAVNTTCFPTDDGAEALTLADFLRPAVMRFYGFPIFQRRYPRRLIDSAFDLFLGRPALLVQHHEYFRDGYEQMEEFVRGLREIEPALAWRPLTDQLAQSCLLRAAPGEVTEVQFFTRRFVLPRGCTNGTALRLFKHEPDPAAIATVLVNGAQVPYVVEQDSLKVEVACEPGGKLCVEIQDRARPVLSASRPGVAHAVRVSVRRALSEFRDNTLARHPRLLGAATGLARKMKATGASDEEEAR